MFLVVFILLKRAFFGPFLVENGLAAQGIKRLGINLAGEFYPTRNLGLVFEGFKGAA